GDKGELRYRGYLITDLAEHSDFVETVALLWNGELPARAEREALEKELSQERHIPATVMDLLRQTCKSLSPMDALRTAVSALAVDDIPGPDADPQANRQRAVRLTARFPTIVAAYDRLRNDRQPLDPRPELSHAANFLYMLNGEV